MDSLKAFVYRIIYPAGVNPLPTAVRLVLFVGLILNSCIGSMPFTFLPKMMQSFGILEVEIGYYTGWVATSIFICNIFASFVWGFLVDKYGAKWCCIASSLCAAVTTILFGLSYNYNWAFCSRFFQGISNGWLVAAKVMLYDITDNTNQSYAMAIISTSYAFGLIVGPAIGGFFAMPSEQYPSVFPKGSFFDKFKFLLPNLVVAAVTVVVSALVIFLVPDTRSSRLSLKDRYKTHESKDALYGSVSNTNVDCQGGSNDDYWNLSLESLSPGQENRKAARIADQKLITSTNKCIDCFRPNPVRERSSICRAAHNKDLWMSCLLFMFFTLPTVGFVEVFSIWALTSKEYHGLGYTTSQIGTQLLVAGCALVAIFPALSTKLIRAWGAKKVLLRCSLLLVFICPLYTTTWLIADSRWLTFVLTVLLTSSQISTYLCFSSLNIFQNNSVPSDLVGLANGLGLTAASIGRSIAPALFGGLFSWSLLNIEDLYPEGLGYPFDQNFTFLLFSFACVIAAVWVSYFPDYLDCRREWPKEVSPQNEVDSCSSDHVKVSVAVFSTN